ncbi:hypothetical protein [Streptomyces acidiscabies]|uniref:hypothetical protein n=1 Tax=Streptomyces acidiscabies TaxID=42234 RepID=UPI00076EDDDD|nr:hypothetical protein [Streptomyces acidiscabies]GAQ52104.1 hypothetical protein a10_01885 [Streptomyces acidiscabies]
MPGLRDRHAGRTPKRPSSECGECGSATWHGELCALCRQEKHEAWWPTREERPAACGKCRTAFDPADTRFDGHAQQGTTPYCRRCVDACHDTEIADHRCVICA